MHNLSSFHRPEVKNFMLSHIPDKDFWKQEWDRVSHSTDAYLMHSFCNTFYDAQQKKKHNALK